MKHSIRRRTSDADQHADYGAWYDEAGYGDRDAADYQSQQHSGLDGETSAEVPPSPLPGVKGALTHHLHSGHSQACGLRVATHLCGPFRACSVLVAFQATFDTGGGIPSGTCALRGGVSLSAESDRHLDLTISPPASKHPADFMCQQDALMAATCHRQLADTTRSGHDRECKRTIYIMRR